jgi:two-component system, sensor histidine kinase and response regulator
VRESDPSRPCAPYPPLDPVVVLLVESNETSRLVTTRMLTRLGYRSDVAGSGREALLAITAFTYAAVLIDCQLPEMDGYETTRELRLAERGTGRHLPVIGMSPAAVPDAREACVEAGMDDYLAKPVRRAAIAEVLQRWIPAETSAHIVAIVREYFDEATVLLAVLREALAEGDPQAVERAARTLGSASTNIGARSVSDACAALETLARAGALGTAPQLVDEATAAFARLRGALTAETPAI